LDGGSEWKVCIIILYFKISIFVCSSVNNVWSKRQ